MYEHGSIERIGPKIVNSNYVFWSPDDGQLTGAGYDVPLTRVVGLFWQVRVGPTNVDSVRKDVRQVDAVGSLPDVDFTRYVMYWLLRTAKGMGANEMMKLVREVWGLEMRRLIVLLTVTSALAAMLVLGGAATAQTAVPTDLRAFMTGKQEVNECFFHHVPIPTARDLPCSRCTKRKCATPIDVRRIKPATAASIHQGRRGVNGPIVVPLNAPTDGSSSGCMPIIPPLSFELSA